jgi:hypothetical protein
MDSAIRNPKARDLPGDEDPTPVVDEDGPHHLLLISFD